MSANNNLSTKEWYKMRVLPLAIATLCLGLFNMANADMIEYENKYSDEVPFVDLSDSDGNALKSGDEMIEIYNDSPAIKNNSWYTTPHTVVKNKGMVRYVLANVRGAGYNYDEPFEDLVLVNCENPRNSYIDRGNREQITLKDSMAIGLKKNMGPQNEQWTDHIPKEAVSSLFAYYCK